MKERPIIFSGLMVRAILDRRKTQTRRVYKAESTYKSREVHNCCLYGQIGDRLWVRESLRLKCTIPDVDNSKKDLPVTALYQADNASLGEWRGKTGREVIPSIHMPRWASRITLEITGVRVERLQDISEADAKSEGVASVEEFKKLWEAIHSEKSWDENPWVWVLGFQKEESEQCS